jgi:hypothetical protein
VTRGGLVHAVHRAARQAKPAFNALCANVRGSPVVTPDETGWKVAGTLQWLWTVRRRTRLSTPFSRAAGLLKKWIS